MNLLNFIPSDANCTYTASSGEQCSISMEAFFKVISEIPERPKIFTMEIGIFRDCKKLPKNYIILSKSVADALEQAIEKAKTDSKNAADLEA